MAELAGAGTREVSWEEAEKVARRVAAATARTARIPAHERSRILRAIADKVGAERESLAALICAEVGKPIKQARVEVERARGVFDWASAEALRFGGEWMPLDLDAAGEGRLAVVRRFPRGACLFITPFNFPLNLAVHKIAPAIAVGAPFVLKPPPQAPRTARALERIVRESGWPEEAFAVLTCSNEAAEALVKSEHFAVLSFTGSAALGWRLRSIAGHKHVVLELGGNAGVVVAADADLPWAAARCAVGGFAYAGQVCIAVQRIFVEEPVYDEFKGLFLKNVSALAVGAPDDERTDVGPLIDERSAARVEGWVREAVEGGGRLLTGGKRDGRFLSPTVVENPPPGSKLACEEVFGPVVSIEKVAALEEAQRKIESSAYGLHAGLFTRDIESVLSAWAGVQVGGLIVNDIPTYRSDAMPYGGTKLSGIGREGVRYAMEEFTEPRTLVLRP